jgi:hypothetical protein
MRSEEDQLRQKYSIARAGAYSAGSDRAAKPADCFVHSPSGISVGATDVRGEPLEKVGYMGIISPYAVLFIMRMYCNT